MSPQLQLSPGFFRFVVLAFLGSGGRFSISSGILGFRGVLVFLGAWGLEFLNFRVLKSWGFATISK